MNAPVLPGSTRVPTDLWDSLSPDQRDAWMIFLQGITDCRFCKEGGMWLHNGSGHIIITRLRNTLDHTEAENKRCNSKLYALEAEKKSLEAENAKLRELHADEAAHKILKAEYAGLHARLTLCDDKLESLQGRVTLTDLALVAIGDRKRKLEGCADELEGCKRRCINDGIKSTQDTRDQQILDALLKEGAQRLDPGEDLEHAVRKPSADNTEKLCQDCSRVDKVVQYGRRAKTIPRP